MFFLLLSFKQIFVGITSKTGEICSKESPCSFDRGKNAITEGDFLFITDSFIKTSEISSFKSLIKYAVDKKCKIIGNNTFIDGREFFESHFLFIDSKAYFSLSNFNFINFNTNIIHTRNVSNVEMNNITFDQCMNDKKISILSFAASKAQCNNIRMLTSSAHDSSLIAVFSSSVTFNDFVLYNSFLFHDSIQPMLMIVHSNVSFSRSLFNQNTSPVSPLIRIEEQSKLFIDFSSFTVNKNTEIVLDDGFYSETYINNSVFDDNHGIVFASTEKSIFSAENCRVTNSGSFENSLFVILKSKAFFGNISFVDCSGNDLISAVDKSFVEISNSEFHLCKELHSLINSAYKSSVFIKKSEFIETITKESVVFAEKKANVKIEDSVFKKSWSPAVRYSGKSNVKVHNTLFEDSLAKGKHAAYGEKSHVEIRNCTMNDQSLISLIRNFNGTVDLSDNSFNAPQNFALSKALVEECNNCKYGAYIIQSNYNLQSSMIIWLSLIFVLSLFLLLGKKKILYFFRFFSRKQLID